MATDRLRRPKWPKLTEEEQAQVRTTAETFAAMLRQSNESVGSFLAEERYESLIEAEVRILTRIKRADKARALAEARAATEDREGGEG